MHGLLLAHETALAAEIGPFELDVGGYGELLAAFHDHGPDPTVSGGGRPDRRLELDQSRFAIELEGELRDHEVGFEAEVEFEHGGTGAALELEHEEFGEYEIDIEKGGEVVLEELFLEVGRTRTVRLRLGRFPVAFGLLAYRHLPTQYRASFRPESESTVLPGVWDEMGLEGRYDRGGASVTLQIVSGLDSTGFSSQRWIASGHQQRFEQVRASDLAYVARLDIEALRGVAFGGSVYFAASTTGNRPKPDLQNIDAPLVLASGHWVTEIEPVSLAASFVWGRLGDAAAITEANRNLSNNLDVLRSPVASEALAAWLEFGVDLLHTSSLAPAHRLGPHLRVERYDTMLNVVGNLFDNPRFERTVLTAGVGYVLDDAVVAKLDWSHRRFGSGELRPQNAARLCGGFVF